MNKLMIVMVLLLAPVVFAWSPIQVTSDAEGHYEPDSAPGINNITYKCGTRVCSDVRGGGSEAVISSANADYPDVNGDVEFMYVQRNGTYDQIYVNIGGTESRLTNGVNHTQRPVACPDNDTIVYSRRAPDGRYHMFKVLISTGTVTQLTSGAFIDGEGINSDFRYDCGNTDAVFTRCTVGGAFCNIAKVPLAGGAVTNLTVDTGSEQYTDPQWNANFTRVTFTGYWGPSSYDTVFTVNADGSGITNHTSGTWFWQPFFCPDDTLYSIRRFSPGNYNLSQVLPNVTVLDTSNYDYFACVWITSHDVFYSKNDGSDDQIFQEHFQDEAPPSGPVPEFSTITLLLAALIALGGMFAFRRFR